MASRGHSMSFTFSISSIHVTSAVLSVYFLSDLCGFCISTAINRRERKDTARRVTQKTAKYTISKVLCLFF